MMSTAPIRRSLTADEAEKMKASVGIQTWSSTVFSISWLLKNGQTIVYDKQTGTYSLAGIANSGNVSVSDPATDKTDSNI